MDGIIPLVFLRIEVDAHLIKRDAANVCYKNYAYVD